MAADGISRAIEPGDGRLPSLVVSSGVEKWINILEYLVKDGGGERLSN